jgi:hypothetical protein
LAARSAGSDLAGMAVEPATTVGRGNQRRRRRRNVNVRV